MSDQAGIESDLARTRARMDERLNELQARLTPQRIAEDVMGYVQGSDAGDFAGTLLASAKRNPVPAVITGIGLAWLMASDARGRSVQPAVKSPAPRWSSLDDFSDHVRRTESSVQRRPDENEVTYKDRLHDAMGGALGIARSAQDTAETYASRLAESVASTRRSLTEGARDLRNAGSDALGGVADATRQAGDRVASGADAARGAGSDMLSSVMDSPIILGALGLGIGALLGALVPQTEAEEKALGGVAGQARTALRDVAQDVVDRGGAVAQRALEAGRESAHDHGLSGEKDLGALAGEAGSGRLTGSVAAVAKDVLNAADDAIHKDPAPSRA